MSQSEESHKAESPWYFEAGRHGPGRHDNLHICVEVELYQDGQEYPEFVLTPEDVLSAMNDRDIYRSLLSEVRRAIDAGNLFPSNKEPGREAVQALVNKIRTAV